MAGRTVLAACEAKWTTRPLDASVLTSLMEHKLTAMAQAGFNVASAKIVLASRSGFTEGVRSLAIEHPNVALVDAAELLVP